MTWDRFERGAKFVAATTWATLELAFWGARPASLAFIASVLGASEAVHFLRRNTPKDEAS